MFWMGNRKEERKYMLFHLNESFIEFDFWCDNSILLIILFIPRYLIGCALYKNYLIRLAMR